MPTTSNEILIDGLPFVDLVAATVARLRQGGPTDFANFREQVFYELIPARNRLAVDHAVAVSQASLGETSPLSGDEASVADAVAVNLASARALVHALPIDDYASYFIASPDWINPVVVIPSNAGVLKLVSDLGGTLELRKPDFGDSDSYEPFRVSRRSRGGDLHVYQDPMWPTTEVLSFKFSYLDPTVAEDLLVFLKVTAGEEMTLIDHFGRTWQGFIITPAGEVVQEKRTTKTAAFKFQVAPS